MRAKVPLAQEIHGTNVVDGDFNQDGLVDLALITPDAELIVLLQAEEGSYRQSFRCRLDIHAQALFAADIDGDGTLDLAVVDPRSRDLSILRGHGDGTFSPVRSQVGDPSRVWSLTSRELEVARIAAAGYTCVEIAQELGISRRTAETHIAAIRSKLELKHKRELVFLVKPQRWRGFVGMIAGALGAGSEAEWASDLVPDLDQIGFAVSLPAWALLLGACWTRITRIFYDHGYKTGKSDANPMEDVDFTNAELRMVEFRRLNLDRVAFPSDDHHVPVQQQQQQPLPSSQSYSGHV